MGNWKTLINKLRSSNGGVAKGVSNVKKNTKTTNATKVNNLVSKTTKASRNRLSSKIGTGRWYN